MSGVLLLCAWIFPVTDKEFKTVQKEIARRKGTETGTATAEERAALEKVTGFAYDRLWNSGNAGLKQKSI